MNKKHFNIKVISAWLQKEGYKVVEDTDSRCFIVDDNGKNHPIEICEKDTGMTITATSQFSGRIVNRFSEEVMENIEGVETRKACISGDSKKEIKRLLDIAEKEDGDKILLKECVTDVMNFHVAAGKEEKRDALKGIIQKVKLIRSFSKDPQSKKMAERLLDKIDNIDGYEEDEHLSDGHNLLNKLRNDNIKTSVLRMRDLRAGDKFFDTDHNLVLACSLKNGPVEGHINGVVIQPNMPDTYSGKPIAYDLDSVVVHVDL